jgi:hypothetical protein
VVVDAVERLLAAGVIANGESVVGLLTGSGLREILGIPMPEFAVVAPDRVAAAMEKALP